MTHAEMSLLLNASNAQPQEWSGMMASAIATMSKLAEAYIVEKQRVLGVAADGIIGPRTLEAPRMTADEIVEGMVRKHRTDEVSNLPVPTTQVVDFRKLDVD